MCRCRARRQRPRNSQSVVSHVGSARGQSLSVTPHIVSMGGIVTDTLPSWQSFSGCARVQEQWLRHVHLEGKPGLQGARGCPRLKGAHLVSSLVGEVTTSPSRAGASAPLPSGPTRKRGFSYGPSALPLPGTAPLRGLPPPLTDPVLRAGLPRPRSRPSTTTRSPASPCPGAMRSRLEKRDPHVGSLLRACGCGSAAVPLRCPAECRLS